MPNKNTSSSQKTQKTSSNNSKSQRAGQSNSGTTIPQSQKGQNASAQQTASKKYQQQGHGNGQAHLATGGQYGQLAATQHVQGSSLGRNTLDSATSAPGQQIQDPKQLKWCHVSTPGNQQGAIGHGSSLTSASDLGAGPGAYGSTMNVDNFRYYNGGGTPSNKGPAAPVTQDALEASEASYDTNRHNSQSR